jgi:hypothetical protein
MSMAMAVPTSSASVAMASTYLARRIFCSRGREIRRADAVGHDRLRQLEEKNRKLTKLVADLR